MSLFRARFLLVNILMLVLSACATVSPPVGKPLPPGYLYKAKFLNIRSPNEEGWYLAGASPSGIQFTHHGAGKEETFIARVSTFPLPDIQDADEFVNFIKRGFKTDTESKRFTIVKAEFKHSDARKYLCVSISAVIKDRGDLTSSQQHEALMLQTMSLYCRHPVKKLAGFAITYSHRGKSLYQNLGKEAKDFIAGVQVP